MLIFKHYFKLLIRINHKLLFETTIIMKKIISIISLSLIFSISTFAQIDDIKDKSKNNKDTENRSSSSSSGDPCLEACATSAVQLAFNIFANVMIQYNNSLLKNSEDPTIISLELMPQFGYGVHFSDNQQDLYKYYDILPRIRGNYGAFSSELRFDYLLEINDSVAFNNFSVLNWQFMFNIIPSEALRISLGQGVLYEFENRKSYHESFLGVDIGINEKQFLISPEARLAYDYEGQRIAYFETGLRWNFRILDIKHLYAYVTLGGAYRNYYQSHEVAFLYGGFNFNIH